MRRKFGARRGIILAQVKENSGQPCSSRSGGPLPVSATLMLMLLARMRRVLMVISEGWESCGGGGGDARFGGHDEGPGWCCH